MDCNTIILICNNYLSNADKLMLLSCSNSCHILKKYVFYNDLVYLSKISSLRYYDNFTNIYYNIRGNTNVKLPHYVTHLTFGMDLINPLKIAFQIM